MQPYRDGFLVTDGRRGAAVPSGKVGREVDSGAPLLVDVEAGCDERLFGLAQADFPEGEPVGAPALPGTGQLLVADRHGGLDLVVDELDQPSSLDFIHGSAYVVTLTGEVWVIPHVCRCLDD